MKPTMFRNPRVVLLALAAVVVSACGKGEHVLRTGPDSFQIEAYVISGSRYEGNDLIAFQARALLRAAEVTQSNGRNHFRIRSQKKDRYSCGSTMIGIPCPPLPPGRDTGRYRLWIEMLDAGEATAGDALVFVAAKVIAAFPNVKALADRLEKAPEHEGGFETEERL